ncbi:hypothetical protein Pfo_000541, partial [Paulownia fortunei]
MSASVVEPHDKMRARDVNRVAKEEQAPRPPQQSPPVSRPPPPSSTTTKVETETNRSLQSKKENSSNQMWRCYDSYYEYHKCALTYFSLNSNILLFFMFFLVHPRKGYRSM